MATIDVIVRHEGGRYFAILKDERYPGFDWPTGKTIRIAWSDSLTGPWSAPGPKASPNFHEAPMLIQRPDANGWYLYFERYPGLGYGLATAPRLDAAWFEVYAPDYATPEGARHGCMVALNRHTYDALLKAFGTARISAHDPLPAQPAGVSESGERAAPERAQPGVGGRSDLFAQ
jgi:hypothetical protein